MPITPFLIIVATLWLAGLTALVFWVLIFFIRLTKDTNKDDLVKVLKSLLEKQKNFDKTLSEFEKKLDSVVEEGYYHIQKVGLVRFNPFKETGGDHSFSLALLDKKDTGFVMTGLHTRDRTRVYIKDIERGKSTIKLSKEEEKSLGVALKNN